MDHHRLRNRIETASFCTGREKSRNGSFSDSLASGSVFLRAPVTGIHQVYKGLDQNGSLRPDQMHADDFHVLVGYQFDKTVIGIIRFIPHGIAFCNVRIVIEPNFIADAAGFDLVFTQADMGDLRFGENGPGNSLVVDGSLAEIRPEQVMDQYFSFLIGLVTKLEFSVDIAQSPDILAIGLKIFIGDDVSARICRDASLSDLEQVGIGADAGSDEYFFAVD